MALLVSSQIQQQRGISAFSNTGEDSFQDLVSALLQEYLALWWSSEHTFPQYAVNYSAKQQKNNDAELNRLIGGLLHELKHMPTSLAAREQWQVQLQSGFIGFAEKALYLDPAHMTFIEQCGMLPALQQFVKMARAFDPTISAEDIYQAGRNVMTANFIQLLLGLPVEVTPSIFAYSMLYPYTDNYLDDSGISSETKLAFNRRFRERLQGKSVLLNNPYEIIIDRLIGQIEMQWDRVRFPQVYQSLLAIHAAQSHSLQLVDAGASPFELDILGISFEKGGTSVLADGYLVAGDLSVAQARVLFGFGAFTQLVDDLEDLYGDQKEARQSVFSVTAPHWPLDRVTNQFIHFGKTILSNLSVFPAACVPLLYDLTSRCIDPVLIDIIARAGKVYSKAYLQQSQQHLPFSFDAINRQRKRFTRQSINLETLFDTFLV